MSRQTNSQAVSRSVEELSKSEQLDVSRLVNNLPGMAYRCRWQGRWTMEWVSRGSARVSGHAPWALVDQVSWIDLIHPNDVGRVLVEIEEALRREEAFQIVYRIFTPNGSERWLMDDGRGVGRSGESLHVEGFISDITERKHAEMSLREANETISKLMREDPLTGLANRRALEEYMVRALAFAKRWEQPLSIVISDLDHFKTVNDQHGHLTGDQVLVSFAQLLKNCCRIEDIVARFGGEEFIMLLPNTTIEQAAQLAERLRVQTESATMPVPTTITASFGVAGFLPDDTEDSLIGRVDQALYEAKRDGRNRVQVVRSAEPVDMS